VRFVLNYKLKLILCTRYIVDVMWSYVLKLRGHGTNFYQSTHLDFYNLIDYSTEIE